MALSKRTIFGVMIVTSVTFAYYVSLRTGIDQHVPVARYGHLDEEKKEKFEQWKVINTTTPNVTSSATTLTMASTFGGDFNESETVVSNTISSSSSKCSPIPANLVGRLKMPTEPLEWTNISSALKNVSEGGRFRPANCISKHKVAIVIAYRNRTIQLKMLMFHLHPILMRQDLDYGIYVVNQADDNKFNRAMLFNVGYAEAKKEYDWDCYIFHDVDLLPEDDRNLYTCPEMPRHMSVADDYHDYKLAYRELFGGVVAISKAHFKLLNGFSNQFWGWGGEDDDMWNRVVARNLTVSRYSEEIARYTAVKHDKAEASPVRFVALKEGSKYFDTDGLSNLQYTLIAKRRHHLFTNITVELHQVLPSGTTN